MPDHPSHDSVKKIGWAFVLNVSFTIIELIAGVLTNSVAILADAVHDLGDSVALAFAYTMERLAGKKVNKKFTYGYKRLSLLSALVNSVVLIGGSIYILSETLPRLLRPEPIHAPSVMGLAILGIIFNSLGVWRLSGGHTLNEKTLTWHLVEDVLGWVGVLIVGFVAYFKNIYILDPLLALLFTTFILWHVVKNIKQTTTLFLQAAPFDIDELEQLIAHIPGVTGVHDTHAWSQDGHHHVISTHVVVDAASDASQLIDIKCRVREKITTSNIHATIEIEKAGETCPIISGSAHPS